MGIGGFGGGKKQNPPIPPRSVSARDEILGRLKAALARPNLAYPPREAPPLTRAQRMSVTNLSGGAPEMAARFSAELTKLAGSCEYVESPAEARMALVNHLLRWQDEEEAAAKGARLKTGQEKQVLAWSPATLPLEHVAEALIDVGLRVVAPKSLHTKEEREAVRHIRYGITGVEAAFATTGSILVASGAETSRVASLLPFRHVALIPMSRLYPTIETWLAEQRDKDLPAFVRGHASLNLITGPSKSADIEQNLTRGVHGPKFIHAILFDDAAEAGDPYYGVTEYSADDDEEILGGLLSAARRGEVTSSMGDSAVAEGLVPDSAPGEDSI